MSRFTENQLASMLMAVIILLFFGVGWLGLATIEHKALKRKAKHEACAGIYTIWIATGGSLSYGYQANSYSNDGDLIVFTNNCNGKKHITPKTSILEIKEN